MVVGRGRPDLSESAAEVLEEPVVATTATGVVVVRAALTRREPCDPRHGVSCRDTPGTEKNMCEISVNGNGR